MLQIINLTQLATKVSAERPLKEIIRSTQLQCQDDILILARVDFRVVSKKDMKPSARLPQIPTFISRYNSRSSVIASITRSTAQLKSLVQERIAVDVADSPVHDSCIRARAQDEFGRFRSPVPVSLGDSQAVADPDDLGGPVAAGSFDFEGSGGRLGAVDVCDVDGFSAVVEDKLRGDGVGGGCEGYNCSCGEGGEVHACCCW